jgi:hypothetical protein
MNEGDITVSSRRSSAHEEYGEAAQSYRHYSALRFAIFSIYVAVIAALGGAALGVVGDGKPESIGTRAAAVGAWLVTALFWIFERACLMHRRYFVNVMKGLEPVLGYTSMTNLPRRAGVSPAGALTALFVVSLAFWSFVIWRAFL